MGSHSDHPGVPLACQNERIGYHRLLFEQVSLVTTMSAGQSMQSTLINFSD